MSSTNDEQLITESVKINIFGQTYSLRSAQGNERVRQAAMLVDERMREIASHLAVHDAVKVAVLAALNLADELALVREHYEREIESLLTSETVAESAAHTNADASHEPEAVVLSRERGGDEEAARGDDETVRAVEDAAQPREDDTRRGGSEERRSWFDEIFDTEFSPGGGPGRLSSQVSSRLQRLRQATREGTIRDSESKER